MALHASAALVGATVGFASVVVHRTGVLQLPLGLVTTFAVAWALRISAVRRLATSYAAGWLIVFGYVLAGRPEGDYAVAGDLTGYLLIAAAFGMLVIGVSSLGQRGSSPAQGPN